MIDYDRNLSNVYSSGRNIGGYQAFFSVSSLESLDNMGNVGVGILISRLPRV